MTRALRYWEEKGLLELSNDESGEICQIRLLDLAQEPAPEPASVRGSIHVVKSRENTAPAARESAAGSDDTAQDSEKRHSSSAEVRAMLACDEAYGTLTYCASRYLQRPLTHEDSNIFEYLYHDLGMSGDLLEYVVEYCVDNGHTSIRYIEKTALDWHSKGIRTKDDAKIETERRLPKKYREVMKAYGVYDRGPAPEERRYLDRWFHELHMPTELVVEACNRTIKNLHEIKMDYTDGILSSWNEQGVRDMAGVTAADEEHAKELEQKKAEELKKAEEEEKEKKAKGEKAARRRQNAASSSSNRFHNFDEVGYDYDAIVKELNGQTVS